MTRPTELVDYTLEIGQPASCITDHGVMYSIVDHFQYATSKGQKPIAGFEAYMVKNHKIKDKTEAQSETENKREHMVLLASNNDGYKRITKMCSIGTTEGFYYRPRIDDKVIEDIGTDGVIGMSACLAGRIAQRIMKDDIEGAEKWAIYYYKLFKGNFYLELQPTIEPNQIKVNQGIIEIHKRTGIPVVATSDFHYLKKEDSETHDALLAIQSRSLINDPNRWRFPGDTFYVMTRDEILNLFTKNGHEVLDQKVVELAVDTTVEVAEKCNVTFEWGKAYLPVVNPPKDNNEFNNWAETRKSKHPEETDSMRYMRYLCIKGLKRMNLTSTEYRERLEFEIEVINKMGFPDYFLIMEDIMRFCRDNGIPTGPARGSAGGSLVAYALDITKIDPLKYNLLFERFLNPDRGHLPDIDSDFCIERGPEVFEYIINKYGKEYCCNVATFGRLQLASVIKDLAKAMGVSYEEVNAITKLIPAEIKHIDELKEVSEFAPFFDKYPKIYEHARKLEGSPRHVSQHAAGICVTPVPVMDLIPVQNAKETAEGAEPGYLSQFEKEQCEISGLIKIDILKLRNVTEIRWQLKQINKRYGLNLTEQDIPLEESPDLSPEENLKVRKAWDLICRGDTLGVFQLAGKVPAPVLKKVQPRDIEALSAVNAFIRPGSSGLDEYVAGKRDFSNLQLYDPRIDKHLASTYGSIVYQEQIMFLISELMGISFGQADLYRRALEKPAKDKKGYVKKFNETVVDIAVSRGFDREVADKLRQLIIDNCGYGFNKCFSGREKIYRQNNQYDTLTLAEMYKIKHDKEYARKTSHLSLHKKYKQTYGYALSMDENGRLKQNNIIDIYYSGKKSVYLMETEDGKKIQCTMNHSFPTPNGKKILAELNIGDELYVLDNYEKQEYKKLNTIRYKNYPINGQKGFQKGGTVGTWLFDEYRKKQIGKKCELCSNNGEELHHIDGNHDNNVIENFKWLCVSCHKKEHYKIGRTKRYEKGLLTKTAKIVKIDYVCDEDVYDVEMADPYHNLLLEGGIVASNSHSIAYSIISYWTAYLKANFPLIFYTTMFNGSIDQLADFMAEAKKLNISIRPPHVCYSNFNSSIEDEENSIIRIGFNAVKGIGPKAVESILEFQPYVSIDDFFERNQLRTVNKKVIEAIINANAFEGLGINIEENDIPENVKQFFNIKTINNKKFVVLSRTQMVYWYDKVGEAAGNKTAANYLIPASMIKSKYLDQFVLEAEKEGGYVIPEDRLEDMGIKFNPAIEPLKTRKKPKGEFKDSQPKVKIPPFRKPFITDNFAISQIKENYLEMYLKENEEFGFSFLSHPLEHLIDKMTSYDVTEDGYSIITAGIIIELIQRQTKTNRKYYWVIIQTPRERVRITLWDNQYKAYANVIQKYKLIKVTGIKGYGGMSCESLSELRPKN